MCTVHTDTIVPEFPSTVARNEKKKKTIWKELTDDTGSAYNNSNHETPIQIGWTGVFRMLNKL